MFPEQAKIANVRPIYKKDKREEIKNYRPISVLSSFSKTYDKFIEDSVTPFVDKFLSEFITAHRKACSTNHVLLRLIEQWKSALDNKNIVGTVLMDLSKVLIASLMIYLFRICILMALAKTVLRFSTLI